MRISYFNYHYEVDGTAYGAAVQIRSIASALTRLGHELDVQFRNPRTVVDGKISHELKGLKKFKVLRRYGHVPKLICRNVRFVAEEIRLIEFFRPDVLLSVGSYCNMSGLYVARKKGIPYIQFVDAPIEYEYSLFMSQYYRYPSLGRFLEGFGIRSADQVICISEILKGYLIPFGMDAKKIHVIPNGVDPEVFKPREPDKELRAKYNVEGRVVVGYVGSFQFFSDLPTFIGIVKKITKKFPKVIFLFVGTGPVGSKMQKMAEENGLTDSMLFTGIVPHSCVPLYVSLMDVVISPYKDDYLFYGSSMKLLEYMASGKAAVVTALGQIKELVHDGCNGMLYEPGDYRTMASKIEYLVENPKVRVEIGANARKTILENWTWDHQALRIATVLGKAK